MISSTIERIINLRESNNWSQKDLAEKMGLNKVTMNKIEHGNRSISNDELLKLAHIFNVSTDYLLGNNEKDHKSPDWATEADRIDLDKLLQSNTPMGYGGMSMAPEDKEKVRNVIEGIYWDRLKKIREEGKK
ncbi:helix-turn-helix transcriptional regulator [Lactiplantibacillus plantarum]|uniref:helix-turn-helix domain-containing protein n=1 Tax=Lactiplantibacillus plantarum TaxID=1590 RepID=UPI00338F99B2